MDNMVAIANELILREAAQGRALKAVRLHKLLYFVQVCSILEGEPAFDAAFQAWEKGPALPSFRDYVRGKGNFKLDRPFGTARVTETALLTIIAFVSTTYGSLEQPEIVDIAHDNLLYARADAKGRNTVLNMNDTITAYTRLHPTEPLIATPVHREATPGEQRIILELNNNFDNEERLESLTDSNYPLLMSLVKTHQRVLSGRTMADVVHQVARNWWDAPQDAVNMLRVALRSNDALVQEQAIKGLAAILGSEWDEDVAVDAQHYKHIKAQIQLALSAEQLTHVNPLLSPYIDKTYASLLHA